MTSITNTENLIAEAKIVHENILLEIIKEVCSSTNNKLSAKLCAKVKRIISECELSQYSSFPKLNTADESTASLLGIMNQTNTELDYDEQIELNKAIINNIQTKLPIYNAELDHLSQGMKEKKSRSQKIRDLKDSIDDKLNTLQEQEEERVELMKEWLNYRLANFNQFSDDTADFISLKSKILNLKSKLLHLKILKSIFTETNQSIKAYTEVHRDLKENVKNSEKRILEFREIIGKDNIFTKDCK